MEPSYTGADPWDVVGSFRIGQYGTGAIEINGGSSVHVINSHAYLSSSGDGNASVTVTGTGSSWEVDAQTYFGGTATLTIEDRRHGDHPPVSSFTGDASMVSVRGAGVCGMLACWKRRALTKAGQASYINIEDGAVVNAGNVALADSIGSIHTTTVTGVGSAMYISNELEVRDSEGVATLRIENGGTVTSDTGMIEGTVTTHRPGRHHHQRGGVVLGRGHEYDHR